MQKNQQFPLTIEDMGVGGEGIGHYEGMTFFVKDAIIGDEIIATATKVKKNYGYGRLTEITKPSPDRVTPPCPVAKQCGGCQIQPLAYDKQLELKAKKVRGNLEHIGGFEPALLNQIMEPIVGMEEPFRYRNKAQFPIGRDKDGKIISGFYASRSHRIVPVDDCMLGVPVNAEILDAVKSYMEEANVPPYDEESHKGLIRHVLIRYGFTSKEIMVCLVANGTSIPAADKLIDKLTAIEGMTSIVLNTNTKVTNVILGDKTKTLWGKPVITDFIGDVQFEISAKSFYQVNPVQTKELYGLALEYAELTGKETVWDLYCGIGTISLFLAQKAGHVYGVEIVPEAIEDARRNARLNGMTNASFMVGKAEEVLPAFYNSEDSEAAQTLLAGPDTDDADKSATGDKSGNNVDKSSDSANKSAEDLAAARDQALHPDVIVVDPPRKGCDEACLETMLMMQPPKIVYVSCDPATLARDLKYLCANGYDLKKVRPVDQFPQSMHVETVALLHKAQ